MKATALKATQMFSLGNGRKEIRVVAVHVLPEFLPFIRSVLAGEDGVVLAGMARDGAAALEKVAEVQPDVLVTCVGAGGFADFVRSARRKAPKMRIVLVNVHADAEAKEIVRSGGVDAFVPAYKLAENLGKTLRKICQQSLCGKAVGRTRIRKKEKAESLA